MILIYGLGRSGLAVAAYLARSGLEAAACDDNPRPEDLAKLQELGIPFRRDEAEVVVAAPGVPWEHPFLVESRARGAEVIGEYELAYRSGAPPILAVTGTAGKTTTSTMLFHILQTAGLEVALGGNSGTPLISLLEGHYQYLVLEASSFGLERTPTMAPKVAVGLNFSPDHLDRHGSLQAYAKAKARVFANQSNRDWAILNRDDPVVSSWPTLAGKLFFSTFAPVAATLSGGRLLLEGRALMDARDLGVPGRHNLRNALAAALAARRVGVSHETIAQALASFRGVEHRHQLVGRLEGRVFIDDSIATRTASVWAALEQAEPPIVWIAGGVDKGADFGALRDLVQRKVALGILIGRDGPRIAQALSGATDLVVLDEPNGRTALEQAVALAIKTIRAGTVLLAPGCTSFDQFQDYRERGQVFRTVVEAAVARGVSGTTRGRGGGEVVAY